ncbi:MAG: MFS transporter [Candidatus Thorarchaeota archaeon]|nr:MFS transporter [Candidatus Thorarchaeota archaeon]
MKVVQKDGVWSEDILERDAIDREIRTHPDSEDLDHIESEEISEQITGLRESLSAVFSWENYRVYLATSWIFNAFVYLSSFFNLYLWNLDLGLIIIGAIGSITSVVSTIARFFGGYVGDRANRKDLAVLSMLFMAVYYLMIGIFIDPILIFIALTINASIEITKGGSTAYIMDNIPREHSGLALSLFTAGRVLSIITLFVFGVLYPFMQFEAFRLLHLIGGVLLLFSTLLRAVYLKGVEQNRREAGTKLWRTFIEDNKRALKFLMTVIPGMMIVCIFDSISDSFFKLGALIYMYEELYIDIPSMVIMLIVTLLIQVPVLLKIGRLTDRKGVKSTALLVYAMMPISAALLIIAYWVPDWLPGYSLAANALIPGLGVIFKTSFLAVVLKYVNDTLWYTIVLVLIRKRLPSQDTSKILSLFWFVVWLSSSLGPLIGGIISEATNILYLFVGVFILNILILGAIARYDLTVKGHINQEAQVGN